MLEFKPNAHKRTGRATHLLENTNGSNSCGMKAMCFGEWTPACSSVTIVSVMRWQHLWHVSEARAALWEQLCVPFPYRSPMLFGLKGKDFICLLKQTREEDPTYTVGLCVQGCTVYGNGTKRRQLLQAARDVLGWHHWSRVLKSLELVIGMKDCWVQWGWPYLIPEVIWFTFSSSSMVPYLIPGTSIYLLFQGLRDMLPLMRNLESLRVDLKNFSALLFSSSSGKGAWKNTQKK